MAIIIKKGELEKVNKDISKKIVAKTVYRIEDFKESNISKKAEKALNKVFLSIK